MDNRYKEEQGTKQKRCSTCKEFFPMDTDHFSKRSASKDGLAYSCKACERKTAAKSYSNKKQKQKAKQRYEENKDLYKQRAKERYTGFTEREATDQ